MRLTFSMAVLLAWLCAVVFAPNLYAAPVLPGEPVAAEQSTDGSHAGTKRAVAIWDRAGAWVWSQQRAFHRALTRALRELRGTDSVGWTLVLMSFLYGVLHAAGPGHGKAVLTTYVLTHRSRLNRGIAMGTAAALLQGITALVLVYGLIGLAGWLPRETETASLWAARLSFTLLAMIGLYLLVRALGMLSGTIKQLRYETGHGHDHAHGHVHGENCGCKHVPSAAEIDAAGSRRAAVGVVLAIGLRPCSGAVLVLILASVMDLAWHGALAVLAMSLGTAITIVTLAILATKAREWARAVVVHRSPRWALAGGGAGVLGGALLLLFGLLLLSRSFAIRPVLLG